MIIRYAIHADCDAMAGLLSQLFSIEKDFVFDFETQSRGLHMLMDEKSAIVLVAEIDRKVVGMVSLQRRISTASGGYSGLLEDVVVDQAYRRRGIGRALLNSITKAALQKGCLHLQLGADRDNADAFMFYDSLGFRTTNLILLGKNLPDD